MKTQIIGVLGLGIFGQTIATELSTFGQDVIALDNNPKTIDSLADQVTKAAVIPLLLLQGSIWSLQHWLFCTVRS